MPKFIDKDGKLAFQDEWYKEWTRPERTRITRVSPSPSKHWTHVIDLGDFPGSCIEWRDWTGRLRHPKLGKPVVFDVEHWETEVETDPIKKPRKRKHNDWKWERGRWVPEPL
jgi:hypothetical protein